MIKIITFGFLSIHEDFLRPTVRHNGQKLVDANHVKNVTETQSPDDITKIEGQVVPQTSLRKEKYTVTLTV